MPDHYKKKMNKIQNSPTSVNKSDMDRVKPKARPVDDDEYETLGGTKRAKPKKNILGA
jgi:hypothetical protein